MNYQEKTVTLKDGTVCRICSPQKKDAGQILEHMRITSEETHHMLRYPDEIMRTREEEEQYLEESLNSETDLLIAAFIGEELVGNAGISCVGTCKKVETLGCFRCICKEKILGKGNRMDSFGCHNGRSQGDGL